MKKFALATALTATALFSANTMAGLIDDGTWDGWTVFSFETDYKGKIEDKEGSFDRVNPGYGGQEFDAEYLLYKIDGDMLSIGVQSGFDLIDGEYRTGGKSYWTGDIALSLDGDTTFADDTTFEYAIDFGLGQCDYAGNKDADCDDLDLDGLNDVAGVYEVDSWNNEVVGNHEESHPFAMQEAAGAGIAVSQAFGSAEAGPDDHLSYYRQVTFDWTLLGLSELTFIDAHWTMSCGNDAVDGSVVVGEPSSLALLALGMVGLCLMRKRKV